MTCFLDPHARSTDPEHPDYQPEIPQDGSAPNDDWLMGTGVWGDDDEHTDPYAGEVA